MRVELTFETYLASVKMPLLGDKAKSRCARLGVPDAATGWHREIVDCSVDVFEDVSDYDFAVTKPGKALFGIAGVEPLSIKKDIEMPSFDCELSRLFDDPAAYRVVPHAINPYDDGRASERIADILWRVCR